MKFTKKCDSTQDKISINNKLRNRRRSSAGMFYTSSAGAVTSLILMVALSFISSAFLNVTGLAGANTYADSISMTVSTDNLTINMAPMSSSGEFAKSGNMNIAVSTTSSSGYNLSIASSTGNTNLKNGSDSITSISSAISESTFSSSSTYNNQWGYKPSHLYNSSTEQIITNTDFRPLPGTAGEIIAKTKCANGTSPCTNPVDNYTLSIGSRTTNTTAKGSYTSDTFVITAVTNKSVISCDSSKLCVEYDGNGLSFPETSSQLLRTVNNVNYNSTIAQVPITKILHSDNVGDDGIATGNSDVNTDQTKETTIDGASNVNVSLYYDTEGVSYDWVALYAGADSVPSSTNDGNKGSNGNLTGKLGGNKSGYTTSYTTWNLWNNDGNPIDTDTIKIHFKTDSYGGSYISYGYYAIITGTGTGYDRSVSSGEYATPTGTNSVFHGWSTSQTTPGGGLPSDVEYTNESEILAKMPGEEGETKTLYAVWQQGQSITFTIDSNVTKIDVLDSSGATVGTITSSGQSLVLTQGDTYTIKPTHTTGYVTNSITKTSGAGTLNGKQFTVGAGAATINVTSKVMSPMQNWTGCSSLAIGDAEEVYDTRDNEVYLIGKLADGNCWMLDNLRLGGSSTMNLTPGDTNIASNWTLPASGTTCFVSGTCTGSDGTTTGTGYTVAAINADSKNATVTSYGSGSGKVGNYYNYCAASGGTYCYASDSGTGNAQYDICPAGWRMPTDGKVGDGEYFALGTALGLTFDEDEWGFTGTTYQTALSTPLSGFFINGSAGNQGHSGHFWSSTWYEGYNYKMCFLRVGSDSASPSSVYSRYEGISLRCILDS